MRELHVLMYDLDTIASQFIFGESNQVQSDPAGTILRIEIEHVLKCLQAVHVMRVWSHEEAGIADQLVIEAYGVDAKVSVLFALQVLIEIRRQFDIEVRRYLSPMLFEQRNRLAVHIHKPLALICDLATHASDIAMNHYL